MSWSDPDHDVRGDVVSAIKTAYEAGPAAWSREPLVRKSMAWSMYPPGQDCHHCGQTMFFWRAGALIMLTYVWVCGHCGGVKYAAGRH